VAEYFANLKKKFRRNFRKFRPGIPSFTAVTKRRNSEPEFAEIPPFSDSRFILLEAYSIYSVYTSEHHTRDIVINKGKIYSLMPKFRN
jgi:hypothetical protein